MEYYAGFFDGEGNIDLRGKSPPNKQSKVRVCINQKYPLILEEYSDTFGGSIYHFKHRGFYTWSLYGDKAQIFLQSLLPYLKLKYQEAKLAIALQETIGGFSRRKGIPPEILRQREELISQFRAIRERQKQGLSPF